MVWTDLSSAFTYNSQLTSAQQRALRDNITALANGDSGAPRIQLAAFANYPKTVVNCIGDPGMDPYFTEIQYSPPCMLYKTSADKTINCKIYGIAAAANTSYPEGNVQVTLSARYNGTVYKAATTLIYAPKSNTTATWYDLNALNLGSIPNFNFFEAFLEYNCNSPGMSATYKYYIKAQTIFFHFT